LDRRVKSLILFIGVGLWGVGEIDLTNNE
jgi:hypothetical protein